MNAWAWSVVLVYCQRIFPIHLDTSLRFAMTRFKLIFLVFLSLVLGACAVIYKAAEDGVAGYRDYQIDKTSYYVEYTEAARVSWEQIHRFALKRSAEITKERGYSYFDVISKKEQSVFLESDVDQITVSSMGSIASDPPVTNSYQMGGRVEGKRVIYRIQLVND